MIPSFRIHVTSIGSRRTDKKKTPLWLRSGDVDTLSWKIDSSCVEKREKKKKKKKKKERRKREEKERKEVALHYALLHCTLPACVCA